MNFAKKEHAFRKNCFAQECQVQLTATGSTRFCRDGNLCKVFVEGLLKSNSDMKTTLNVHAHFKHENVFS